MTATGNATASTPEAPVDGGGGSGGAGQSITLSAGGGGADSGAHTQALLTRQDELGFQRNLNEQSRQYGVMAALAPLRYPVVVGVIAFGLISPDPAYAPTFQTTPEDRPSVLERAGETGLAVAVGAIGIKLGQIGTAAGTPKAYSVAFEAKLTARGVGTYGAHVAEANEQLLQSMADPALARALRSTLGANFESTILSPSGRVLGSSPQGWTWHHVPDQAGVLQLVPRSQHAPGSAWQSVLHPGGEGGMAKWGSLF
jgi:hypothetical protein